MSNKIALRELQLRLASRLQAAREQPREAGWLAVECATVGMLLPLAQAGEIQSARDLMSVPHAASWMAGVANVRGQLNAVVDLAAFLGLREAQGQSLGQRQTAQLVVLNSTLRVNCALMIDRLLGLRDAGQLQRAAAPEGARPRFACQQWRDAQGRLWEELDLAALVQDPLFLNVAA
jgi:twitching motility protein PilI